MSRNHQELCDSAYLKVAEARGTVPYEERFSHPDLLTNLERVAVLLGNFHYQVENGGLAQYVDNGYAEEVGPYGVKAYEAIEKIVNTYRDIDPEVADRILDMVRVLEDLPSPDETEVIEEEIWSEEEEQYITTSDTVGSREVYVRENLHDSGRGLFALGDRVLKFFQSVLDAWDEQDNPFTIDVLIPIQSQLWKKKPNPSDTWQKKPKPVPQEQGVRYPDVNVNLVGLDGNAYAIMARVRGALRRAGVSSEEIKDYEAQAKSGDYDNLLAVTMEWVATDAEPGQKLRFR